MFKLLLLLVSSLVFVHSSTATVVTRPLPVFADSYYVEGTIGLPYASINEPFKAWYDQSTGASRVDYYGDLVKTVQLSNTVGGQMSKLAYMVDSKGDPQRVCFRVNGTQQEPVAPQSVLPDLTGFRFVEQDHCPSTDSNSAATCERWEYTTTIQDKKNTYMFWLIRSDDGVIPVHYMMYGYDSLLGSHYDRYEIAYKNYQAGSIDPSVFSVADNYTCRGFPGPGVEHRADHNPIMEFINRFDEHTVKAFERFKNRHNKEYKNDTARRERLNNFRHNYRFIQSMNRNQTSYRLAVNHLSDLSDNELRLRRGRLHSKVVFNGGSHFDHSRYDDVPSQWDWRLVGAVTPVKDQAICGSCWSFGTSGTIEGVYFVKTGHLVRLSQQQMIDCSWNEGDNGCDGGEDFRAYDYIMKAGGLATEDDYGPYLGADGRCHDKTTRKTVQLSGFYNVTPGNAAALRKALFNHGPVTIAIDASHKSLSFYSHGVYYEPKCGSRPEDLDHQVLAVGYGQLQGKDYWLVKNSWSTYWGNDGYVLMAAKDNNCGVLTSPTFPIIKD